MSMNPFTSDAFSLIELTQAIQKVPYRPTRIAELGWFEEEGTTSLDVAIEEQEGTIQILGVKPRGASGDPVSADKRKIRSFRIPHIPEESTILADEVLGVRAYGTMDNELIEAVRNRRLEKMRASMDYTIESHRISAIKGNYIDVNGDSKSLFTEFSVTQQTVAMALTTASTKVRQKALQVIEAVEDQLDGVGFSGIRALCGKNFWSELVEHANVKESYLNWTAAASLREDARLGFEFGGIFWERYRGTSAVKIEDDDAYAVPEGVSGLFLTRFAPADTLDSVGVAAMGLPYYVLPEVLPKGKGISLEGQSNPLNLATRPSAIVKMTKV